jgi:hypothetical protein
MVDGSKKKPLAEGLDPFRPSRSWGWFEHNLCIEAFNRCRMRSEITPAVSEREGRWERYMVGRAMRIAKRRTDVDLVPLIR